MSLSLLTALYRGRTGIRTGATPPHSKLGEVIVNLQQLTE
jgi:hypothetical protein